MQNENLVLLSQIEALKAVAHRHAELGDNWEFMQKLGEVEHMVAQALGTTKEQLFPLCE